ncbi:MAG TPA: RNA 2',3'-cyclic phosphodiesterase [Elusimicrobiota bacterium]|nr:RNA 2',3'-cyclic phosphodiesterase [Elusimicrobiota bacterium]
MRLFYAAAADEEVKAAAAEVVARLRRAPGHYRWVDPRDMHVTFRFLGETPEAALPEVEAQMRRAAAQSAPFELVYGGVGAFDSLEDPRVVWIGLDEGAEPMERIADLLGRDERRPFSPHLTLGRRKREREPIPGEFLAALRAEPRLDLRRRVERISLYASRPAPFGHAYEILLEAELKG